MRLAVSLLPDLKQVSAETDVAVVIDVLRATSVMTTALAAGAEQVITCEEIDAARELARQDPAGPLLCGERGCRPIEGFDLGNSPKEYVSRVVRGKSLILTTTNGTRAVTAAGEAKEVLAASFLNLSAVVRRLSGSERIVLICAGTDGAVTVEDVLLAGAITALCRDRYQADTVGDETMLAEHFWRYAFMNAAVPAATDLAERLGESTGGRNLIRAGYDADLKRCAVIDWTEVVPRRSRSSPATFVRLQ